MRCALLAAIAAAVLASPAGAATVVVTSAGQPISALAAGSPSGALVACGRVVSVASPATLARFPSAGCFASPQAGADSLVLPGQRVAWLVYGGGTTLETSLVVARQPATLARRVAFVRLTDAGGRDFAGLVVEGDALVWALVTTAEDGSATTALRRSPVSGPDATITTLDGRVRLLAAGQGRLVVVDAAGHALLLDGAGALVRDLGAGPVHRAVILSGVVYLLRPDRIDLHSLAGDGMRSIALDGTARAASSFAVRSGVAVYTTTRAVRAVRIGDGRDAFVAWGPSPGGLTDAGLVGATIDAAGLLYAFNDRCSADHTCRGRVFRAPVPSF